MEKLFCSSCNAKSIEDGKKIIYECPVLTNCIHEYTDWYTPPKDVGYHEKAVKIKKLYTK